MNNKNIIYISAAAILAFLGWKWYEGNQAKIADTVTPPVTDTPPADTTSPAPVQPPAPTPTPTPQPTPPVATIMPTPAPTPVTVSTLTWALRENGAPFIDTNLEIYVNNVQVLQQWSSATGSIDLQQGDSVNLHAFGGASWGNAWGVPACNTLIATDNGNTISNQSTTTDSDQMYYSFIVQGGHAYNVLNYTLPTNQSARGDLSPAVAFYNKK